VFNVGGAGADGATPVETSIFFLYENVQVQWEKFL